MHRFFIEEENGQINNLDIVHHLTRVLRSNVGDEIILCYKEECFVAKLTMINKNNIQYDKLSKVRPKTKYNIDVLQGMPKSGKIEDIIKNNTHLGVDKLIITNFVRSVGSIKNFENKISRFDKIINQAAMLSHRDKLMELSFVKSIKNLNYKEYDLILLADEEAKDHYTQNIKLDHRVLLIIGPEGGISEEERIFFKELGAKLITLGDYILPTELASLSAVSQIVGLKQNNKDKHFDK